MKKVIFLSAFLILLKVSCFSQSFEILNQNTEYSFKKAPKEFYFISKDLDESKGIKVADMKFYARDKGERISLVPVFYSLWKRANKLGANSFFITEIKYDPDNTRYDITVELFFLDDDEIDENLELYPKNLIVFVGNVNTTNEKKGKTFKLNDEELTLYPFQYITYEYNAGENITIQVGGLTGSTIVMKGDENKFPQFLTLGGVSITPSLIGGVGVSFQNGSVNIIAGGLSFRNGTINSMDMNLGLFLMKILGDEKI